MSSNTLYETQTKQFIRVIPRFDKRNNTSITKPELSQPIQQENAKLVAKDRSHEILLSDMMNIMEEPMNFELFWNKKMHKTQSKNIVQNKHKNNSSNHTSPPNINQSTNILRNIINIQIKCNPKQENIKKETQTIQNNSKHQSSQQPITEEMHSLSYWGIPQSLMNGYKKQGITKLYKWQIRCMNNKHILKGGNLIYSAPTGGGKTLVAELLMVRNILRTKRKALFVLPFVSIVIEKVNYFKKIFKKSLKIRGFYSSKGGTLDCDIAICTIEKANSIINKLITDNSLLETIGIIVLDEMHMIGDGYRGYILELLLTKVQHVQKKAMNCKVRNPLHTISNENQSFVACDLMDKIQIVGLSATLPNLDMICQWLCATKFVTDYRPIPLKEYLKIGNEIFDNHGLFVRKIGLRGNVKLSEDSSYICVLCAEVVQKKLSCLIFCHSKKQCQITAEKIAKILPKMLYFAKDQKLSRMKYFINYI